MSAASSSSTNYIQIGQAAPRFKAMSVMPDLSFKEIALSDFAGKYVWLLFYPLDFSIVCPTGTTRRRARARLAVCNR